MSGAVRRPSRANPRPSGTGSAPGGQTHADQSDPNAATIDLNAPTGGDERRTQRQQRADALAGKELGDVTIQGLLGKGGMATVYRGLQRGLERQVAVKVLSPRLTKDPQQVEQFLREARTLARLEHPNIVTVYQVGQLDDLHYLVMQLIEGGSLVDRLKAQGGQLPVAEAVDCARQIALGLGEAHLKGIVHRDIKPANVLCAPGGVLKITDYGLARMVDDSGASFGLGGVVGTPHYMAPEQVDAREVDARTDLYALGATLYHLLTGRPPFQGKNTTELLLKHVGEPIVPPHELNPEVPAEIFRVVGKLMAKQPAQRFRDAASVVEALAQPAQVAAPGPAAPEEEAAIPELLLSEAELPPLAQEVDLQALGSGRTPLWLRGGWAAAVLVALGLGVAGAGRASAAFSPSEEGPALGELAADAELERQLAQIAKACAELPLAEAAGLWRQAEAKAAPGSALAERAGAQAQQLETKAEQARKKLRRKAFSRADRKLEEGKLGPALDAVRQALTMPELAGDRALLAAHTALVEALSVRGQVWLTAGPYRRDLSEDRPQGRYLAGFYLGTREVTVGEFQDYLQASGAAPPWGDRVPLLELPVSGVTLDEARAYARFRGARLPSPYEWEKAARCRDGRPWPWGEQAERDACNWAGVERSGPLAPASFPRDRTPAGLFDLAGNVAELTWENDLGQVWVRGGAFLSEHLDMCRAGFYQVAEPDFRHPAVGFRLAFDAPAEGPALPDLAALEQAGEQSAGESSRD